MHPITAGQFITGLHADRGFQPIEVYLRKSTTVMVALAWDGTTTDDEARRETGRGEDVYMVGLTYLPRDADGRGRRSPVVGTQHVPTEDLRGPCPLLSAALAANERNMGKPATDPNRGIIAR